MMSKPLYDRRAELQGKPAAHALIFGISDYPYLTGSKMRIFGIEGNSSAAITGYRIYRWLMKTRHHLAVPLATCRVLLSPSAKEIEVKPELKDLSVPCTLEDFLLSTNEWRADAGTHRDNLTFFYFAGNGFELSKSNPVIMLRDFGNGVGPTLRSSVAVNNLFYGMGPTSRQPDIAQTQLYFIDTDRALPSEEFSSFEQMNTTAVFDAEPLGIDDRNAAIFYASTPGRVAYAIEGGPTVFSIALIMCLDGAAAVPGEVGPSGSVRWHVSTTSLVSGLKDVLVDLNRKPGRNQTFEVGGQVRDSIIRYLKKPPPVDLYIEIDPIEALPFTRVEIRDEEGNIVHQPGVPLHPHPYNVTLAAGYYTFSVKIDPAHPRFVDAPTRVRLATPPRSVWKVRVIP